LNIQLGQFQAPPNNTRQCNGVPQFNEANQSFEFNEAMHSSDAIHYNEASQLTYFSDAMHFNEANNFQEPGHRSGAKMTDAPEPVALDASFAHQEVAEDALNTINTPPTLDYRPSFCMPDASGYIEPETSFTNQHMTGAPPFANGELADLQNYTALAISLANTSPTSDDRRRSMRHFLSKSTERLRAKLHQGATLEHPDLPPNMHMPRPSSRR